MRWERPFLAVAALHNAVWAAVIGFAPERAFETVPPVPGALALVILAMGACFAVNAVRRTPVLLLIGLISKILGPLMFVLAVQGNYLRVSSWPLVLLTDLVWIPPLVALARRRGPW